MLPVVGCSMGSVRAVVLDVLGAHGDDTMLDYLVSAMEDEDFEWGADGEAAYDHLGPFIVGALSPPPCPAPGVHAGSAV